MLVFSKKWEIIGYQTKINGFKCIALSMISDERQPAIIKHGADKILRKFKERKPSTIRESRETT